MPMLYDTEPTGVNGQLEAYAPNAYCSGACLIADAPHHDLYSIVAGIDPDLLPDHVCDYCGGKLERPEPS